MSNFQCPVSSFPLLLQRAGAHAHDRVDRAKADQTGQDENGAQGEQDVSENSGDRSGEKQGGKYDGEHDADDFVGRAYILFHGDACFGSRVGELLL